MNDKVKRLQGIVNKRNGGYKGYKKSRPADHKTINTILCDMYFDELPLEPTDEQVNRAIRAKKRFTTNY